MLSRCIIATPACIKAQVKACMRLYLWADVRESGAISFLLHSILCALGNLCGSSTACPELKIPNSSENVLVKQTQTFILRPESS